MEKCVRASVCVSALHIMMITKFACYRTINMRARI